MQNLYHPYWGGLRVKPYILAGNAMAAFLDFSAGVFIVYLGTLVLDYQAGIPSYVLGGILGMAPDFDVFYMFFKKKAVYGDHHQFVTHRPLFGIVLSSTLGFLLGGTFWAMVAPLCVVWHYLHDTEGFGGGGIAWFWPFSKFYYSPLRIVPPEKSLMAENQDEHEEWLETTWLVPSKTAVIEITIGSVMLGVVSANIFDWKAGLFMVATIWLFTVLLWLLFPYHKASAN
jgi:hypothetical protein